MDENNKVYVCKVCGKTFFNRKQWKEHLEKHIIPDYMLEHIYLPEGFFTIVDKNGNFSVVIGSYDC